MNNAENDAGLFQRIDQIERSAHRVIPVDVGEWRLTSTPGPADGVVVAPADLAWLLALARTRVSRDRS